MVSRCDKVTICSSTGVVLGNKTRNLYADLKNFMRFGEIDNYKFLEQHLFSTKRYLHTSMTNKTCVKCSFFCS